MARGGESLLALCLADVHLHAAGRAPAEPGSGSGSKMPDSTDSTPLRISAPHTCSAKFMIASTEQGQLAKAASPCFRHCLPHGCGLHGHDGASRAAVLVLAHLTAGRAESSSPFGPSPSLPRRPARPPRPAMATPGAWQVLPSASMGCLAPESGLRLARSIFLAGQQGRLRCRLADP